jgi:large subunit ribosomal protein L18e
MSEESDMKSNPNLTRLIGELQSAARAESAEIWRDIATRLGKPLSGWAEVNLGEVARTVQPKSVVVVPGKLLGGGDIDKPVVVASFKCSASARRKLEAAGGRAISISQLLKENPKGSGVVIMR